MPEQVTADAKSQRLSTRDAVEKFAGLISSPSQAEPAEPEVAVPPTTSEEPEPTAPAEPDATTEETAESPTYTVKVHGQELQVDLDELRAGYQRDADYRHKTESLASERREAEAELAAAKAERAQYQATLSQLTSALESLTGEPDWNTLHSQLEPAEFLKQKADWERQKAGVEKLKGEQAKVQERALQDAELNRQKFLRAEQDKLKAAIPDFTEPEKAKALMSQLRAHAKTYGFTDQDVDGIADSRAVLVLRDAMKYRELHREPSPVAQRKLSTIKPAKPGTPERPRPNATQEKAIDRAAKSARVRDAADAILTMLPD
jgi:hypothetical protein